MSTPRAALAFAEDVVSRHGEPVANGDSGQVRVRLTQQQLARQHGCAPSTISWYLRRLGPAVIDRRGGLVFDRHQLSRLDQAAEPLAPRTLLVERKLVEAFARPTPDGTRLELVTEESGDLRSPTLHDLAVHLGINRSSAHRHITALERSGRLQREGRRLYLVGPKTPQEPTLNDQPAADHGRLDPGPPVTTVTAEQVFQLLERVTDLLSVVADMANRLLPAVPATTVAQDPRSTSAQTAARDQLRASPVAAHGRGSSSELDLIDKSDLQITSNQSHSRAAESRNTDPLRAGGSQDPEPPDWTLDQLPKLLAPLLEECLRLQLPGVTDAQRVADSLRPYRAEQIVDAARQMAVDLRSGAPMRSPIAILVRKAEDRDPYYFRAQRAPATSAPSPPVVIEPEEPVDAVAQAAVESLGPEALRHLDEAVAAHVRSILGERTSALESPDTLAYWRPIVWRSQHEPTRAEGM